MTNLNDFTATKIICTLGPSSDSDEVIAALVKAGMSVARLNFSHGSHSYHMKLISTIRNVAKELDRPIAILQDLTGPKIRIGRIKNGAMYLRDGGTLKIVSKDIEGDDGRVSASPTDIIPELEKGDKLFIDDGLLYLKVLESDRESIVAEVIKGGILREHKGINVPDSMFSLPSMTDKDREDLEFGIRQKVDYVALSFVRSAEDIRKLKKQIKKLNSDVPVVAKLEKPQAVENLREILGEADVVMVARGDLGIEIPIEQVPAIQKQIITAAREMLVPVITATQMLESMTDHVTPTRAEVSDVANAIYDGTDCVMLSAETAAGNYPLESVRMMSAIALTTEQRLKVTYDPEIVLRDKPTVELPVAIAQAAVEMASDINATLIACFTQTGLSARLVSKQRTNVPIIAYTPHRATVQRLCLLRGVIPRHLPQLRSIDHMIERVEEDLKKEGLVSSGDRLVIVASAPVRVQGDTNMLKLHEIA